MKCDTTYVYRILFFLTKVHEIKANVQPVDEFVDQ